MVWRMLLAVNGTLMRGLALNSNLLAAGATFVREARTRPVYRLWSIGDVHPAMVRVRTGGAAIALDPTSGINRLSHVWARMTTAQIFPGGLLDVRGRYHDYLQKKDELLAGQASYQESLANRVRGELAWLSRKARARTRKAQARKATMTAGMQPATREVSESSDAEMSDDAA